MGRSWQYVTAWMVATAAAVTVSWLGVQVGVAPALTSEAPVAIDVDRRYTEVRLGPSEVVPEPGVTPAASTRPTPSPSPARSTSVRPAPSSPAPGSPTPGSPALGSPAATRSARSPSAPAPTASAAGARPAADAAPSPSRAAAPDRRPRYRIPAQGGVVIVAYSSTRVDVVAAAPAAGYTATVDRRGERLLVVRLAGPTHASVVTVYWLGGPGARIMEESSR